MECLSSAIAACWCKSQSHASLRVPEKCPATYRERQREPDRDCYPEKEAFITHREQQQLQWLPGPICPTSPVTNSRRQNWPRRTRPSSVFYSPDICSLWTGRAFFLPPFLEKALVCSDVLRGILLLSERENICQLCGVVGSVTGGVRQRVNVL